MRKIKFLRSTFLLILTVIMLLIVSACSKTEVDEDFMHEQTVGTIGSNTTTDNIKDPKNIMRADGVNTYSDSYVLGGNVITREEVTSIIFTNTLANAPETAWDVSAEQDGSVVAWVENESELFIAAEGDIVPSSCKGLFCNYLNVTSIQFNDCFNTADVTDMSDMFANCWKLSELQADELDTKNVQNMDSMFYYCSQLCSLELSNWNTENTKSMRNMFEYCKNLTTTGNLKIPPKCDVTDMFTGSPLE